METFSVTILGCGSATPTLRHYPSAQIVNVREKLFLIDCGEGAQLQMMQTHQKMNRLSGIFVSHLHGDHMFGLPGLISTLALHGRTADLHIYAHAELEQVMRPWLDYFCRDMMFEVVFHPIDCSQKAVIYEDRSVKISSLPLRHRVPTTGFLFEEQPLLPHIRRDMIDFLGIPTYAINTIKQGEGWTSPDGKFYPTSQLTTPATPSRSYAYCSDTMYMPALAERVRGVNLLYHEATFSQKDARRARETFHSTTADAARVAREAGAGRLVIGHFSARYDDERQLLAEAREGFADTILAREGLCVQV